MFRCIARSGTAGRTCYEVEQELRMPHQSASARVYELHKVGAIRDSGATRTTGNGREAVVWIVAEELKC